MPRSGLLPKEAALGRATGSAAATAPGVPASRTDQTVSPTPVNHLRILDFQATLPHHAYDPLLDISVSLLDDAGDPVTGAQVYGTATDRYADRWEGYLIEESAGLYRVCQVGWFYVDYPFGERAAHVSLKYTQPGPFNADSWTSRIENETTGVVIDTDVNPFVVQ